MNALETWIVVAVGLLGLPHFSAATEAGGAEEAIVFVVNYLQPCGSDAKPKPDQVRDAVWAFASPGEYEPVTVAVRAREALAGVSVEVADLTCGENVIAQRQVDVRVEVGNFLEKQGPVDIPADTTRRFWLIVHVPHDAPPGNYRSQVSVKAGGRTFRPLTLELEVLPMELLPPDGMNFFVYYLINHLPEYAKAREYQDMIARDMKAHGMTTMTFTGEHAAPEDLGRQDGLGLPMAVDTGMETVLLKTDGVVVWLWSVNFGMLEPILRMAIERSWPEVVLGVDDEPAAGRIPRVLAAMAELEAFRRAHPELKVRTTVSTHLDPGVGQLYDILIMHAPHATDAAAVAEARRLGKEVWCYECKVACGTADNAERNRYYYGHWAWKAGLSGCSYWNYNDGRGGGLYPSALIRPAPEGPVPSPGWEAVREGVDDYRYLLSLKRAIRQAFEDGRIEAANQAERTLVAVEGRVDVASLYWSEVSTEGPPPAPNADPYWWLHRPPPQEDIASHEYDQFRRRLAAEIVRLTGKE